MLKLKEGEEEKKKKIKDEVEREGPLDTARQGL